MPEFLPFVRRWFTDSVRRGDPSPARRLGGDRLRAGHAHRGPDRLGQDAGRLPVGARPPAPARCRGTARGPRLRRLRLAAARAQQRHREEPARAAGRHPRRGRRRRPGAARGPRGGAHGRHAGRRPPGDDAPAAARADHHARVALHPAHEPGLPSGAGPDALRHRRRGPRDAGRQARRASGAVAGAPAGAGRGPDAGRAAAAHRLLGDGAAGRGRARRSSPGRPRASRS